MRFNRVSKVALCLSIEAWRTSMAVGIAKYFRYYRGLGDENVFWEMAKSGFPFWEISSSCHTRHSFVTHSWKGNLGSLGWRQAHFLHTSSHELHIFRFSGAHRVFVNVQLENGRTIGCSWRTFVPRRPISDGPLLHTFSTRILIRGCSSNMMLGGYEERHQVFS